ERGERKRGREGGREGEGERGREREQDMEKERDGGLSNVLFLQMLPNF
nr:hypothetical protein [Tanacetum cinerariifolium]